MSAWGSCSVTCGVGYKLRNVTCVKGDHVVPLSDCEGMEPDSRRECMEQGCARSIFSTGQFSWQHGPYKPCSQTCGRGMNDYICDLKGK